MQIRIGDRRLDRLIIMEGRPFLHECLLGDDGLSRPDQCGKGAAHPNSNNIFYAQYPQGFDWREKGAVGVDMETSAVFSVSQYLGVKAAALLMASDLHPLHPEAPKWEWLMSTEMRRELTEQSLLLAKQK